MNDNQKFWHSIWRLVAISFCVLTISMAGCVANNKRILAEMVKDGADPMQARCAIGVDSTAELILCAAAINGK